MAIKWNEVIDSDNLNVSSPIEKVNEFLWRNTVLTYFLFNGKIYRVLNPLQFEIEKSETSMTIKDIE